MAYALSPSTLSIFKDCPRCFWLHINRNLKRPIGIYPSLPSGMDQLIKARFDHYRSKGLLPPEVTGTLKEHMLFSDQELLDTWRNPFQGVRWTDEEGNVLKGAVDELLINEKKLVVFDFKTRGFPLKEDSSKYYLDQLSTYSLLLKNNGYKTQNYGYLLFYYPIEMKENQEVIFKPELIKVELSEERALQNFKAAITALKGSMPAPSNSCCYCSYVKSYPG